MAEPPPADIPSETLATNRVDNAINAVNTLKANEEHLGYPTNIEPTTPKETTSFPVRDPTKPLSGLWRSMTTVALITGCLATPVLCGLAGLVYAVSVFLPPTRRTAGETRTAEQRTNPFLIIAMFSGTLAKVVGKEAKAGHQPPYYFFFTFLFLMLTAFDSHGSIGSAIDEWIGYKLACSLINGSLMTLLLLTWLIYTIYARLKHQNPKNFYLITMFILVYLIIIDTMFVNNLMERFEILTAYWTEVKYFISEVVESTWFFVTGYFNSCDYSKMSC